VARGLKLHLKGLKNPTYDRGENFGKFSDEIFETGFFKQISPLILKRRSVTFLEKNRESRFFGGPKFDHQFDHQNHCFPSPRHVSTRTTRTLRIWPRGKSATAERMAVVSIRSEHALGVPPYKSSAAVEVFDRMPRVKKSQLRTVASFPLSIRVRGLTFWHRPSNEVLPHKLP
jgi:hypothetical protein